MQPEAAILVHNYLHFSFVVVFVYDCFLTFPDEVERVWKRLRIRASRWYLINRYFTLAGFILVSAFQFIELSPQGCSHFSILRQALIVLNVLVIAVVFSMRTYALYDRSKLILAIIIVPSMGLLGTACWALGTQTHPTPYPSSLPGCHTSISEAQAAHIAVAWECLVGFDVLLFILTVARTLQLTPAAGRSKGQSIGCSSLFRSTTYLDLVGIIYRDGAAYFGVMGLFNLVNVITFYAAPDLLRGALSTPNSAISALLCARLMLNIHEAPTTEGACLVPSGPRHADNGPQTGGVAFTSQFDLGATSANSFSTTTGVGTEFSLEKLSPTREALLPGRSRQSSLGWLPSLARTKSGAGTGEEWELEDMNVPPFNRRSIPVHTPHNT